VRTQEEEEQEIRVCVESKSRQRGKRLGSCREQEKRRSKRLRSFRAREEKELPIEGGEPPPRRRIVARRRGQRQAASHGVDGEAAAGQGCGGNEVSC
jgi:hypothetical protein